MRFSGAFTMIELIFIIVVIGILSAIAIPKFASTGTQARIAAGKADVMAVRSAIMSEREKRIIKGDSAYITKTNLDNGGLFGGVLTYAKTNKDTAGHWHTATTGNGVYQYNVDGATDVQFDYNATSGKFTCSTTTGTADQKTYCKELTQ